MIKVTLRAQTEQLGKNNSTLTDHIEFSGLNAGVCYMPDNFESLNAQPPEVKIKRGKSTISRAHHSVAGHVNMQVLFEGIPKICAMILNSLFEYNTSEKSGRYTVMEQVTEEETELYNKWISIYTELITKEYGCKLKPANINKLALENSRYLLSVFSPTVMVYSSSLRQFNYIIDWCHNFKDTVKEDSPEFFKKLSVYLMEIADGLHEIVYIDNLRDTKNRGFSFINRNVEELDNIQPIFSNIYQTKYKGTFVHLADVERHRSLLYKMYFNGISDNFYVPHILRKHDELVKEWLKDIGSLAHLTPQGTLVDIYESGTAENFILKAKERECACAQLEVQEQTILTHTLYENSELLTPELKNFFEGYKVKVRCGFSDYTCKSPCSWGINAPNRLI